MEILRPRHIDNVLTLLHDFPVVLLLGPRQVGKSTLAREIATRFATGTTFFDLEDPDDLARLSAPKLALEPLRGLVVLDEVQRLPTLLPLLRVLADRPEIPARFLLLGSASPQLRQAGAESLAGRMAHYNLPGFALEEVGDHAKRLWLRGGFPRAFIALSDASSHRWRREFVRTFLERDLPQLGIRVPAETMRRFWTMLAHYHGQRWNGAELARAFGVAHTTVKHYLDILVDAFVVRRLAPWHENISKRQVKAPKVYLHDSGLVHALLGIESEAQLLAHPKMGASWEGFALGELLSRLHMAPEDAYFWAAHSGAEVDCLLRVGAGRFGFEFKYHNAPKATRSAHQALALLQLDKLFIVHPGTQRYALTGQMEAVPLRDIDQTLLAGV